ncbi:SAF domain-containing protein [Rhodococcus sp. C-2]|uniref:SAF domain-containing protein n=1 Tax=Rhodococcus sp. C-2 TaxID=3018809 RepID=UPI0022EB30F5|nr:SAF domain-containing protein [Rhodococcus sp. C-2]MDA3637393.1 SAF domain-containing protein [Rhodococcus sp. C-2]
MASLLTKKIDSIRSSSDKQPAHNGADPDSPPDLTTRARVRRRPIYLAIGVALVVVAVIGMLAAVSAMRATTDVLVLARDVQQGQIIESKDLTVKTVNVDADLGALSAGERGRVIGMSAGTRLPAGTVLMPAAVTDQVVPGEGLTMVGITVGYPHLPSEAILPGDMIRVVDTPREGDDPPVTGPINTKAQVYSTTTIAEAGETTLNLLVPEAEANWVAARAATKRVSIVLDNRVR